MMSLNILCIVCLRYDKNIISWCLKDRNLARHRQDAGGEGVGRQRQPRGPSGRLFHAQGCAPAVMSPFFICHINQMDFPRLDT